MKGKTGEVGRWGGQTKIKGNHGRGRCSESEVGRAKAREEPGKVENHNPREPSPSMFKVKECGQQGGKKKPSRTSASVGKKYRQSYENTGRRGKSVEDQITYKPTTGIGEASPWNLHYQLTFKEKFKTGGKGDHEVERVWSGHTF